MTDIDETVRDVLKELRRKEDSCRVLVAMSLPGWIAYRTEMAVRWGQLADAVEGGLFERLDAENSAERAEQAWAFGQGDVTLSDRASGESDR